MVTLPSPSYGTAPVTLLFTDLVSSTELLQRAGDERAQRVFQAHHRLLKDTVAAHGGQEVKWLGDGLMTVFASAADAVREETDYFGTPVVIARRLCEQAQAGQILASGVVVGLLAGRQAFRFSAVGALDLSGLTTPVAAYEVPYQQDEPAALLTHTPFVGRTAELARLGQRLKDARAGRCRSVAGRRGGHRQDPHAGGVGGDGARRGSDRALGPLLRGGSGAPRTAPSPRR